MSTCAGVDELRSHTDPITGISNAPLHDCLDVERFGDLGNGRAVLRVRQYRRPRDDVEIAELSQLIENFFVQSGRDVRVVGIGTQVIKWQYRN